MRQAARARVKRLEDARATFVKRYFASVPPDVRQAFIRAFVAVKTAKAAEPSDLEAVAGVYAGLGWIASGDTAAAGRRLQGEVESWRRQYLASLAPDARGAADRALVAIQSGQAAEPSDLEAAVTVWAALGMIPPGDTAAAVRLMKRLPGAKQ